MVIEFDKGYLSELYYEGKASDKKHRFQPQIVKRYKRVVDILMVADRVEDLFLINSLNYEKLSGDKAAIESVRVNDQYRIEFVSRTEGEETLITICKLLELSNHYK